MAFGPDAPPAWFAGRPATVRSVQPCSGEHEPEYVPWESENSIPGCRAGSSAAIRPGERVGFLIRPRLRIPARDGEAGTFEKRLDSSLFLLHGEQAILQLMLTGEQSVLQTVLAGEQAILQAILAGEQAMLTGKKEAGESDAGGNDGDEFC